MERNAMLRTKAMREKEEQRERRKYNYTLLRVRLPDGILLQGNEFQLRYRRALSQNKAFLLSPVVRHLTPCSLTHNELTECIG